LSRCSERDTPDHAIGNAIRSSRSHDAVIRVYDAAGNVIETHDRVRKTVSMLCRRLPLAPVLKIVLRDVSVALPDKTPVLQTPPE